MSASPLDPGRSRTHGLRIEYADATDPGLDPAKKVNEDACAYEETPFGHLFVTCDGMGGHAGGKQASNSAISTIFNYVRNATADSEPRIILKRAIEEAARQVYALGGAPSNPQRPGSTCVAVLMHDGHADVAHVGDSRAYAVRGEQIYRLTRDHSMVQEMIDNGVISEQEAIGHPDSNKITRALGMTPDVEVELRDEALEIYEGDIFILATDGLTDLARGDDILVTVSEYIRTRDAKAVCDELVALANRRGGHDNITVQVARVMDAGRRPGMTIQQEPSHPIAGSQVAATIAGSPARPTKASATVVQTPAFNDPPTLQEAPTLHKTDPSAPPPPEPSDAGSGPQPMINPVPGPMLQHHDDDLDLDQRASPLMYVVVAMAAVIGLLLALLIWALAFR